MDSNMTLKDSTEVNRSKNDIDFSMVSSINSLVVNTISSSSDVVFVYVDLETAGFSYSHDILQVALKCGENFYDKYIYPTGKILSKASEVHGITCSAGQLYLNNVPITSLPKRIVAGEVLQFLSNLGKPCILIGHNINSFDIRRLLLLMKSCDLLRDFCNVVIGCTDTYLLFKEKFPDRKEKGAFKLTSLVKDLIPDFSFQNAHNAFGDICALEALTVKFYSNENIFKKYKSLKDIIEKKKVKKSNSSIEKKNQTKTDNLISKYIIKKLSSVGITVAMLKDVFSTEGKAKTIDYLKGLKFDDFSKSKKTSLSISSIKSILGYLNSSKEN